MRRPGVKLAISRSLDHKSDALITTIEPPTGREYFFGPPSKFWLFCSPWHVMRSVVTFEVSNCTKFHRWGCLQRSPDSLAGGEGGRCPLPENPTLRFRPFGPRALPPPRCDKKLPPQNKFGLTPTPLLDDMSAVKDVVVRNHHQANGVRRSP